MKSIQENAGMSTMIQRSRKGRLEGDTLAALLSPYWSGGYREDEHVIDWVQVEGRTAMASCTMSRHYSSPTDPAFHLTVFNATAFLCQIGIVHALFLSGLEKKTVEAWLTDFSLLLPSKIQTPKSIVVEIQLISHSATPSEQRGSHYSFFKWGFAICDRWKGSYGIAFPAAR